MPKLVVKPIERAKQTDRLAFNIDNDSFPVLLNAYQWRGRIKRKRGTSLLNRLARFFSSSSTIYNPGSSTIVLDGSGSGNLLTGFTNLLANSANASLVPGSISIVDSTGPQTYTDPGMNGILVGSLGGSGTINYQTGAFTIAGGAGHTVTATFQYYPALPVMGLEEWVNPNSQFLGCLAFDTIYSYNISTSSPYTIYDVSFYKNPPTATYIGYTAKTNVTPLTWNGQDYQQFWTTNYQGALWATNGITLPFSTANIGMQFKPINTVAVIAGGPPATATLNITAHGLVVGDFVFVNQVATTTGINFQTGYVITVTDANNVIVEFPNATIASNGTGGIAQYLTSRSDATKDCIRWFDGDPTNGIIPPTFNTGLGWVNFMPPLSRGSFSIDDTPSAIYYLVGCRIILPFKDRLLFIGPVIQSYDAGTATAGAPIYLQDTVIYSQNGTPYYTASFTGDVSASTTVFNPILVPKNQTATANAYFEDQTGFGGFISAGYDQDITTAVPNEDTIIIGFTNKQTRFVYTGNDLIPFNFFSINSELGSASTFSAITLDRGAITIGANGIILSSQVSTQRIDLQIPDQIFQFSLKPNGFSRVCAQRDFINEWIYFTYLDNESEWNYPNQTLLYNYRDNSWAIFNESYTTYGTFRRFTGQTWATLPPNITWNTWTTPWNAGGSTLLQPEVIAGNQQGFVMVRDSYGTSEGTSLYIQNIVGTTVTSTNHNLNNGDFIVILGALGMSNTNGAIFGVGNVTTNTFDLLLNAGHLPPTGTYGGGGLIQRMYIPFIQTKQFPVYWDSARKTRIGNQQYLLTTTNNGQMTLYIYLSTNDASPYNFGTIVPDPTSINNTLIYSTVLYTCPESTNIGLTPANINLQMVTGIQQNQTWHRMNTSLIGDTVQLGFTLSDEQMFDPNFNNQFSEIELHTFVLDLQPSQLLA